MLKVCCKLFNRVLLVTTLVLLTQHMVYSQQSATGAQVTEKFDKLYLSENFDSISAAWTTVSNAENLILVQDGEYILNRRATFSPYAVLSSAENNLAAYRLVTSLKIFKSSSDEGSIGLIFMAQEGGKGGFIFEINKDQQYRLRQIVSGSYKLLSGDAKSNGWTKSSFLKGANLPNLIEIRTAEKKYDLIINNQLAQTFSEVTYATGNFGYIIGPASKGSVDFLYLFTNQKNLDQESQMDSKAADSKPENDVLALAESIITLKTQINKLNEINEDLKQQIAALDAAEKDCENQKKQSDKTIKGLQGDVKKGQAAYDSLLKVNADLMKYKELVAGNDGGDLVINLSKNLKAEKLKSEQLTQKVTLLQDSITGLKSDLANQKKNAGKDNAVKAPADSNKKNNQAPIEFVLPKEN